MTDVVGQAPLVLFPRAEVRDLLQSITGVKAVWEYEPIPFLGQAGGRPGYYVELAVIATETKGVDDVRLVYDPINQVNGVTQVSNRICTVQVKVVSYDKERPASDIMDQVLRGLRSDSAKNEYVNINIALVDWDNVKVLVMPQDNREITNAICSVRFGWSVSIDPGDNDGGIILTAPTSGTLTP